jgi:hypothetical protein
MITRTKIVVAVVVAVLGTASSALAGSDRESGGYVLPGSTDGVNPVDHPRIFGNSAAAGTYGFVPPAKHAHHASHRRTQDAR